MSETQLRVEGMRLLREKLGLVDAEEFINLLLKDHFDYTQWQEKLWEGKSIENIAEMAREKIPKT
jgi:hypothetical protein